MTIQSGDTADQSLFVADSGGLAGTYQYYWDDGSHPGLTRLCVTFTPSDLVHYLPNESCVDVNINLATNTSQPIVESRLPVGLPADMSFVGGGVTVDSLHNLVYAGRSTDGTIAVIDGTTNQIIDTIRLEWGGMFGWAYLTAVDPAKNRLYVLDWNQPLFWTVDATTRAVISATPLEDYDVWRNSISFELNPTTGLAYVGTLNDGIPVIAVVDPERPATVAALVQTRPDCGWTVSIAVDPVTNLIYGNCGDVVGGDPLAPSFNQVISNLNFSGSVAVNPRTHTVYVSEQGNTCCSSILAFDGNPASPTYAQLASRMQLADYVPALSNAYAYYYATSIAVNPVSNLVYVKVSDNTRGAVAALDGSTLALASFTWGSDPAFPVPLGGGLAVNANTGRVYLSGFDRTVVFRDRVPSTAPTAASANPVAIAGTSVSLVFSSVSSAGTTTVVQVDASNLGLQLPGQFLIDGALAYEIRTTATVSPPIQLCFNVSSVNDQDAFNALAVLHGENGAWVDRTTSRDFATRTICATVNSLSPFAIARSIEPMYGMVRLYDSAKSFKAGSTAPIRLQITDAAGVNLSTASLTVHAIELRLTSTSASSAVVDSGQSNPDQNFRFDAGLGGSGGYIFNLKTTGLSTGSYELRFTVGSGRRQYSVPVQIR